MQYCAYSGKDLDKSGITTNPCQIGERRIFMIVAGMGRNLSR